MSTAVGHEENAEAKTTDKNEANDNHDLLKLIEDMGYPESEARQALARASNNLELAIQYLVEGIANSSDEEELSDVALRRRTRHRYKQLHSCLMDNPAITDYAVAALMKRPRTAEALREMVGNQSVQFLESLLESSSDEEEPKC